MMVGHTMEPWQNVKKISTVNLSINTWETYLVDFEAELLRMHVQSHSSMPSSGLHLS